MNIVTIGGGGGHAQILKGLKGLAGVNITAICPNSDSGGSTGELSRQYGGTYAYLGDLTKCVTALSPDDKLSQSLLYRFADGPFGGHSIKNILFIGLEKVHGFEAALNMMYSICGLGKHKVIPVTDKPAQLCARLRIGKDIQGETEIDNIAQNPLWNPAHHAIKSIYLNPRMTAAPAAIKAIDEDDWLIICPGDLYSSILPVILPAGIREAISRKSLRIIYVLNLMTKKGETDFYKADDFVFHIERHIGRPVNFVLGNSTQLTSDLLSNYALEHKIQMVVSELGKDSRFILAPLAMTTKNGSFSHDPKRVAEELRLILEDSVQFEAMYNSIEKASI